MNSRILFSQDGPYRVVLESESDRFRLFRMVGPGDILFHFPPFLPYFVFTANSLNSAWTSGSLGHRDVQDIPVRNEYDDVDLLGTMPNYLRLFEDPDGLFSEHHLSYMFMVISIFMGHRSQWIQEMLVPMSEMFVGKFGESHRAMIERESASYFQWRKDGHWS